MGESVVSDVDGEPIEGQTSPLEGKKHLSIKRVLENTGTEGTEVTKRTTPIQRFQAVPSLSVLIPFIIEWLERAGNVFVRHCCVPWCSNEFSLLVGRKSHIVRSGLLRTRCWAWCCSPDIPRNLVGCELSPSVCLWNALHGRPTQFSTTWLTRQL